MPKDITIVSPVTGETVYLTSTADLSILTDFETDATVKAGGTCSLPTDHPGSSTSVTNEGEAEVKFGPHSPPSTYPNVTLTAKLLSNDGNTTYAQSSVAVTVVISTNPPAPVVVVTDPAPPKVLSGPPYVLVSESGVPADKRDAFYTDPTGVPNKYDPKKYAPKKSHEVDPNKDFTIKGTVANGYRDGYVTLTLMRQRKKTGLVTCHFVPQIPVNMNTGEWSHTVTKNDVQKLKKLRLAVITLFVKDDAVETVSIPLKLK